jgi:2-keto-3-deoxy-L-rhamnonate aldolase RhmA
MCQVESEEGVKKAEEISAVDGVDCVQMGPLDLSASMGYLWDPGHKKVREMMREAEKGVLEGGAYLCGFAMPHDGPINLKTRGYIWCLELLIWGCLEMLLLMMCGSLK